MIDFKSLLNEEQGPKAVEEFTERLAPMLMAGEELVYMAVQKKPAVNITPDCVALTTKRIIFCRPRNLGFTVEFQDYIWRDIKDTHIKEGMLGADFTVRTVNGAVNTIDYLPKAQARKLYTLSQEQEEIQSEFRRQRGFEDHRGRWKEIQTKPAPGPGTPAAQTEDPMTVLQKLKQLLDNGLIEQAEYDAKKAEVLKRL